MHLGDFWFRCYLKWISKQRILDSGIAYGNGAFDEQISLLLHAVSVGRGYNFFFLLLVYYPLKHIYKYIDHIFNAKWTGKQKIFILHRPFFYYITRLFGYRVLYARSAIEMVLFFLCCCCFFPLGLMNITTFRLVMHFHCTTAVNLHSSYFFFLSFFADFTTILSSLLDISPLVCATNLMLIFNVWMEICFNRLVSGDSSLYSRIPVQSFNLSSMYSL